MPSSSRVPFTLANSPTPAALYSRWNCRGFTIIELTMAMLVAGILFGFAIPLYMTAKQTFETSGDSRKLASLIAQAKMRAAADYTHARLYANLNNNSYHLEFWNKSGNSGAGCWQTDGDTANSCTATSSPVFNLEDNVSFGYGKIGGPPSNTQSTIGQAPACFTGYAGESTNTTSTANTACIEFNSRGVPSDPDPGGVSGASGGVPDATGALYVTDGQNVYGTTVLATGFIQNWYSPNATTPSWQQR